MRKRVVFGVGLVALVGGPAAVVAATGTVEGALDRQAATWTTATATTASREWRDVAGLSLTRCTRDQVTVTVGGTLQGGPALLRVVADGVPETPLRPGPARVVPDGRESFSLGFAGRTATFEADDTHRFNVQWRSPTGARLTLRRGLLNLLHQRGTQGCP